jgi:hypothetical protein
MIELLEKLYITLFIIKVIFLSWLLLRKKPAGISNYKWKERIAFMIPFSPYRKRISGIEFFEVKRYFRAYDVLFIIFILLICVLFAHSLAVRA